MNAWPGSERSTRARIARLILENGPVAAAGLSTRLNLTPAAVRRHLDNLLADGLIETRTARRPANRGRGRPAKLFAITDVGRSAFEHAYDDLATSALRFLAEAAGPEAVAEFARRQVADLERRYGPVVQSGPPRPGRGPGRGAVRGRLRGLRERRPQPRRADPGPGRGEQLCQHHCPVAHVAAEFPQLCEAETEAFARLLGTPVQRLATIAHGDGICTTHVTAPTLLNTRTTSTTAQNRRHLRMTTTAHPELEGLDRYKFGWADSDVAGTGARRGLSEEVVRNISGLKNEPQWMLDLRLKGLKLFDRKPMPNWGADLSGIDFENIKYFVRSTEKQAATWDELPEDIKNTYDELGIPEAEKQRLIAGVAAQYESEVVYHKIREDLEEKGVMFQDTDTALREHPELFQEYFATVIPPGDNKFAALNTSVWSGGSFIYVPKNVHVEIPLQAYFRINTETWASSSGR